MDQIYPERVFPVANGKKKIPIDFCIIEISLGTNFLIEADNFDFLGQIYLKGYFQSKT